MYELAETPVRTRAVMPSRIPVRIKEPALIKRGDSAPSKLEQLAAAYRQKLYREKLKKLTHPYQNGYYHVLYESRGYGSAGNDGREGKQGLMREFFRERHALEHGYFDNRQYQSNINYHYQKKKTEFHQGVSPAKPPIPHKNRSAGRDRSKPLAPINRQAPAKQTQELQQADVLKHIPKPPVANKPHYVRSHYSASNSSDGESPQIDLVNLPPNKALIPVSTKKKPIPAISSHASNQDCSDNEVPVPHSGSECQVSDPVQRKGSQEKIHQPQAIVKRSPQVQRKRSVMVQPVQNKPEKLTSYQKWQMEQNVARQQRLQQYRQQQQNNNSEMSGEESDISSARTQSSRQANLDKSKPPSEVVHHKKNLILKKTRPPTSDESETDDEEQAELLRKQAELEALIEKQKHELEEMRRQREIEEENERIAREKRQKRLAAEQAKKLKETEERSHSHLSHRSSHPDLSDGYQSSVPSYEVQSVRDTGQGSATTPVVPSHKGRRRNSFKKQKQEQNREPTPNNEKTAFYLEMASMKGAVDEVVLTPCPSCGRKFAEDRLPKHVKVCQSSSKKRKVFDPMKMRIKGTEFEQYAKKAVKAKREKTPPRKTWRVQHENFIKSIRYAKKVTAVELAGGNIEDLPPPPVTENPDYKQCPYCERRFNPSVAERHIPRCKNIKARPAPPKQRQR